MDFFFPKYDKIITIQNRVEMLLVIDLGITNRDPGSLPGRNLAPALAAGDGSSRMPDEYGIQILSMLEHGAASPRN